MATARLSLGCRALSGRTWLTGQSWARAAEPTSGLWDRDPVGIPQILISPSRICVTPPSHWTRSSPCPNVKHGDEWGDPGKCENGDTCQYCHTRTEQQFHPEVGLGARLALSGVGGFTWPLWKARQGPCRLHPGRGIESHRLPDRQCLKKPCPLIWQFPCSELTLTRQPSAPSLFPPGLLTEGMDWAWCPGHSGFCTTQSA